MARPRRSAHGPCQRRCRTGVLGIHRTPAGQQALHLGLRATNGPGWEDPGAVYVQGANALSRGPSGKRPFACCRSRRRVGACFGWPAGSGGAHRPSDRAAWPGFLGISASLSVAPCCSWPSRDGGFGTHAWLTGRCGSPKMPHVRQLCGSGPADRTSGGQEGHRAIELCHPPVAQGPSLWPSTLESRAFLPLGCAHAQSVSVTLAEALAFLCMAMGGAFHPAPPGTAHRPAGRAPSTAWPSYGPRGERTPRGYSMQVSMDSRGTPARRNERPQSRPAGQCADWVGVAGPATASSCPCRVQPPPGVGTNE
jgi:hypothetical protein